jgi:hypothetical protein
LALVLTPGAAPMLVDAVMLRQSPVDYVDMRPLPRPLVYSARFKKAGNLKI